MGYRNRSKLWLALGAVAIFSLAAWTTALTTAVGLWLFEMWTTGQFNPGPHSELLVLAVPVTAGGIAAAAYVGFGLRRARRARGNPELERRALRGLAIVPAIAFGLLALDLAAQTLRDMEGAAQAQATADRAQAQVALEHARFAPQALVVQPGNGGDYAASAELAGRRAGQYLVSWSVEDGYRHTKLVGGEEQLALSGPTPFAAHFTTAELAQAYRAKALGGQGGVQVAEDFTFRLRVAPVLGPADLARLPTRIAATDAQGELAAEAEVPVPVAFTIH